nr:3'-5' exonuclease [Rhabdothermincola salaria]
MPSVRRRAPRGRQALPPGLVQLRARRVGRAQHPERFAVVDLETTGLDPATDRVIEIAVVTVDGHGRLLGEWSALVDPGRDPGPTEVHGITAADLAGAADFATVAAQVAPLLAGTVVVAHNLAFDAAFLAAEQRRVGADLLAAADGGLCTLDLSRRMVRRPAGGWSLAALCAHVDVALVDPHRALVDARATAGLLAALLAGLPSGRPRLLGRRLTRSA